MRNDTQLEGPKVASDEAESQKECDKGLASLSSENESKEKRERERE